MNAIIVAGSDGTVRTWHDVGMEAAAARARLVSACAARGWRSRVVAAGRLEAVRASIEGLRDSGALEAGFYDIELADTFEWDPPSELRDPRSVIVLARAAPETRLTVEWGGRPREVVLPPTYRGYRSGRAEMLAELKAVGEAVGFGVHPSHLPEKSLAARSGLARYGRNNITFHEGIGTHALLFAAWSDLSPLDEIWGEPEALERCETCRACAEACPTGAIGEDRFLLHGERCLTHLNEWPGEFPEWVPSGAHNALVGCMRCQEVCPENRAARRAAAGAEARAAWTIDRGPAFTEEETRALVAGTPREELSGATLAKLDGLDTFLEHELVCRNLAVLLAV